MTLSEILIELSKLYTPAVKCTLNNNSFGIKLILGENNEIDIEWDLTKKTLKEQSSRDRKLIEITLTKIKEGE